MLDIYYQKSFKKDFAKALKRGCNPELLEEVLELLVHEEPLPAHYVDHLLKGDWASYRDAHIEPDWLLIYRVTGEELHLARTGTHADLFN